MHFLFFLRFVFAKLLFRFLVIIYRLLKLPFASCIWYVNWFFLLGCENGSWCFPAAETDKAFHDNFMKNVLFSLLCSPHFFLYNSLFSPLSKSAARPCGQTSYSPAADPAQTWHQFWGMICQLPQGRREHDIGGTELKSSQGIREVYYKLQAEWNLLKQADRYLLLRFL